MDAAEATRQYQNALEAHRRHDDDATFADLEAAEQAMNAAWLRATTGIED